MRSKSSDNKKIVSAVSSRDNTLTVTASIHQSLGNDLDRVTAAVARQYEANPYPLWNKPVISVATTLSTRLSNIGIREIQLRDFTINSPRIMVAGCGTGKHAISTATSHPTSKVVAVDLSLSSLAYAFQKAAEFGITNIEFHQASILSLPPDFANFDLIECSGVLHHLDDPQEGLRHLSGRLATNGVMKVALYSALARKVFEPVKRVVSDFDISSDNDLRSARSLIKSQVGVDNVIYRMGEFYSLSGLRDLLFHEKEHHFRFHKFKI